MRICLERYYHVQICRAPDCGVQICPALSCGALTCRKQTSVTPTYQVLTFVGLMPSHVTIMLQWRVSHKHNLIEPVLTLTTCPT